MERREDGASVDDARMDIFELILGVQMTEMQLVFIVEGFGRRSR